MQNERNFLKIAHMGASAYAPENTLRSIRKALKMNVNAVEVDVQASKDGHLIVFHDLTLKRVTKMNILVKDLTFSELKRINVGDGERIPTLEEVFQCILGKGVDLIIELKVPGITQKVYHIIKKHGYVENVIVDSFFHKEIYKIKSLCKMLKTGIDLSCMPIDAVSLAQKAHADYILMEHENLLFHADFPEYLHRNGIGVIVWTIDEIDLLKKIVRMGVDGVMTNDPKIFES
jgi:glycerophosphoryl diester phosphodiesterase